LNALLLSSDAAALVEQLRLLNTLVTVSGVVAICAAQLAFVGYVIPVGRAAKNPGVGVAVGVAVRVGEGVEDPFSTFNVSLADPS